MSRSVDNPWLHRFAWLTALATLALIGVGGVVTSKGVGMAVPDWPTTYGYNMFLFPVSKWVGGILYEHSHRLLASGVGLLTTILAVWLWLKESRRWLRWLGVIAFFGVVLQGVLGGLRVTLIKDELGIFHATLAQLFFVLISAIALFTSRWWRESSAASAEAGIPSSLRRYITVITVAILLQLVLGATMRHQHAGLAVPDFPLAYGNVWPPTDVASLQAINRARLDVRDFKPITAAQIHLHMTHRILALLIVIAVTAVTWTVCRQLGFKALLSKLSLAWLGLIFSQAILGAATVWSNKAADVATMHVVVGALSLMTGTSVALVTFRLANLAVRAPTQVDSLRELKTSLSAERSVSTV